MSEQTDRVIALARKVIFARRSHQEGRRFGGGDNRYASDASYRGAALTRALDKLTEAIDQLDGPPPKLRKIAIVGTRPPHQHAAQERWAEYACIIAQLEKWIEARSDQAWCLVSGGAAGVDVTAKDRFEDWVQGPTIIIRPDYKRDGQRAPLDRNVLIVAECDELHAWPSSWSRGTWHAVQLARFSGKPCEVHEPWKQLRPGASS